MRVKKSPTEIIIELFDTEDYSALVPLADLVKVLMKRRQVQEENMIADLTAGNAKVGRTTIAPRTRRRRSVDPVEQANQLEREVEDSLPLHTHE
jgi:hypothetical protein